MQHFADASATGVIRRSLLAATIGLVAIFASIVIGQPFATDTASAASATSGDGPQVSLICKRVTASGLALCRLTSVEALEVGDQVTFQASTPDGSQQDVTIEYQGRVGFRDAPSCDGPAACYVVWFRMQQAGANQVAISGVTYQPVGSTAPETIIEQPEPQAVVSAASPTISPTSGSTQQAGVQTADETGDQSNGDQSASGQATSAQTIESGGAQAQIRCVARAEQADQAAVAATSPGVTAAIATTVTAGPGVAAPDLNSATGFDAAADLDAATRWTITEPVTTAAAGDSI